MTAWLRRQGSAVNHQPVGRLWRPMGVEAISPKPRLSPPAVAPDLPVSRARGEGRPAHQGWSADITSVCLAAGLVDRVAMIDWCSRYVGSWAVSMTMEVAFGVEALDHAWRPGQPENFNTDQGAQFTRRAFTARLQKGGLRISMDGRGRALDHVFVERWWRTVTSEQVSLRDYQSVRDAGHGLTGDGALYHHERLHQALGDRTPAAVWNGLGGKTFT